MKNKHLKKSLILGLSILLLFSLRLPVVAENSSRGSSPFPLSAGTYKIPNVGPVVIKAEDLNAARMGNFNRLEVEGQKDSLADNSTNLFKHAQQMLPGDQVTDFVYIYNRPDENVEKRINMPEEEKFLNGGLVILVARLPQNKTDKDIELEKDYHGVEGYLENPLSKQLLHETLIHIDPVVFRESGDPFQRLEEQSPESVPLENREGTQRVDGCSFQQAEGSTKFTKQEYHAADHEAGRAADPVILGFITEDDHLGMRIQLKVPLWLGNEFENQEGRIFWDFYYVPGTLIYPTETDTRGTSVVDTVLLPPPPPPPPPPLILQFIPNEEPATALPGLIFLGKDNPFGALPKTGGDSWTLSTAHTIILLIAIGIIGLVLFEVVGQKKKPKTPKEET